MAGRSHAPPSAPSRGPKPGGVQPARCPHLPGSPLRAGHPETLEDAQTLRYFTPVEGVAENETTATHPSTCLLYTS
ncbi:MAG: hypothetical protein N2438_07425, partial [Limisphaera sp.]|nr:hypothetical protein [Limisphaera sp.]